MDGEVRELIVDYGIDIIGAIVILIIGWIVAGWARSVTMRLLNRSARMDATLKPFFGSAVRYLILAFVITAVLAQFGVQTTSLIAMLGAAGLAIGLALQGTLSNVAAGVMLLFFRPFSIGDFVDADGLTGTVDAINLFSTEMRTPDGVYITTPNANLWNRTIKNFSRLPTRRVDIAVGIGYGDDIDRAQTALQALMDGDDRVLKDPAAETMVLELGDSAVVINMRCWTERGNYWGLLFDLRKRVKQKLDAEGISIPFPQQDVHMHTIAVESEAA